MCTSLPKTSTLGRCILRFLADFSLMTAVFCALPLVSKCSLGLGVGGLYRPAGLFCRWVFPQPMPRITVASMTLCVCVWFCHVLDFLDMTLVSFVHVDVWDSQGFLPCDHIRLSLLFCWCHLGCLEGFTCDSAHTEPSPRYLLVTQISPSVEWLGYEV